MSPGAMETLLSGEAAANILLPASAAKMRAEKEGIASAVPSSKYRIKRKIIPSDGDRTAQKAKAEQQTQRDASVPRLAFKTAEKLPGAIGVPQQQVPAAQELLEQHANGMQISGEEEQPAAEQDAIQMEASAVNQQHAVTLRPRSVAPSVRRTLRTHTPPLGGPSVRNHDHGGSYCTSAHARSSEPYPPLGVLMVCTSRARLPSAVHARTLSMHAARDPLLSASPAPTRRRGAMVCSLCAPHARAASARCCAYSRLPRFPAGDGGGRRALRCGLSCRSVDGPRLKHDIASLLRRGRGGRCSLRRGLSCRFVNGRDFSHLALHALARDPRAV